MILIDAIFINKGGGAVLLQYLIEKIVSHPQKDNFFFLLDPRFEKPAVLEKNYTIVPNKVMARIKYYRKHRHLFTKVFCFANTPPPVKLKIPVYTYFQNQKVLEAAYHKFEPNYRSVYIKYLFVKLWNKNTDYYIVQTPHMVAEMLKHGFKDKSHYITIPFYNDERYKTGATPFDERPTDTYVFVSTPSPQKNYPTLLAAWEYLCNQGHTPELHITIDDTSPELLARVEELKAKGAMIYNYKYLDPKLLYFKYRYLICPSVMESFGLPLIEAVDSGMKVLAPDMPYVHDVITPSATFNPLSKESMAAAVIMSSLTDLPFPTVVTHNEVDRLVTLLAG